MKHVVFGNVVVKGGRCGLTCQCCISKAISHSRTAHGPLIQSSCSRTFRMFVLPLVRPASYASSFHTRFHMRMSYVFLLQYKALG
jgi:hypothetical protein